MLDERRASPLLLSTLPADLQHRILQCCRSMDDLSAVIRTSKRIYGVYKDHPSSILRSVACNHMGMTDEIFPFAFGLVLYHEWEIGSPVKDWLGEDELSASHLNPSRFFMMVRNHDVVATLEKKFSQSCKDSRFGYSVLSGVESHRFQTSAYLFWQFQALFGIDASAKVSPWEYEVPTQEGISVTPRLFLERIPAMSLLHLSAFKDYLLGRVKNSYRTLESMGFIEPLGLTKEQILHLLLSAGVEFMTKHMNLWEIVDMVNDLNQEYAGFQLWFATDLDLAIESGEIPPQVRNSDDAKLVIRQGPIYAGCRRCKVNTWPLYNNTNHRDVMSGFRIYLPSRLWTNQVEINRLGTHVTASAYRQDVTIPDDLLRELLWPSHIPLPSLENPADGEPDTGEAVFSLVKVPLPLPDRFPNYTYDPRHMLCLPCHKDVSEGRFWSWWEVQRRLPPVSAPDQPVCWRGIDCSEQGDTDHAAMYNHLCPNTQGDLKRTNLPSITPWKVIYPPEGGLSAET